MHTLVVGGTRMLAGVTKWLAEREEVVSVVSRRQGHVFKQLSTKNLHHIAVDYRHADVLRQHIHETVRKHGPIQMAVLWIHTDAPAAFSVVTDEISEHIQGAWRLFHVRGSAAHLHPAAPQMPTNCLYRQVILGFVKQANGARWLTNQEISGGVIDAIQGDRERFVVGTLEPWEQRPR